MIPAKYWSPTKKLMLLGAMAGGKAVEDTATGNPLTFLTDLAKPLKSLLIPFTPRQSGSGDPSPSNIRPIVPWDGLTVKHGGKNLLDKHALATAPYGTYDGFGFKHKLDLQLTPNTYYTLSSSSAGAMNVLYFNGTNSGQVGVNANNPRTQNSGSTGILSILLYDRENIADYENELIDIQLEVGQTATAYEPYVPITETDISFPSPVYGGSHEAVSGKLMDGWDIVDLGSLDWTVASNGDIKWFYSSNVMNAYPIENSSVLGHIISDRYKNVKASDIYSDVATNDSIGVVYSNQQKWMRFRIKATEYNNDTQAFKTAMNGVKVAYQLETPQEIQLTPAQITALVGNNTIWSDADGSMTAVYFKKG